MSKNCVCTVYVNELSDVGLLGLSVCQIEFYPVVSFNVSIVTLNSVKMDCELPDEFELIVIGTGKPSRLFQILFIENKFIGMVESIVASAASRIGKKVLHVDR